MTDEPRIYVDEELFLGRLDEQDHFREALRAVTATTQSDDPSFIFLLYGEGGMGKSKLLRRLRDIATTEPPFEREFQTLLVDWELERSRSLDLQVARGAIRVEDVFDHIHRAAMDNGWGRHFKAYQDAVKLRGLAEKKVAEALAREAGESRYAPVRDLGAELIAALVRRGTGVSGHWQEPLAKVTSTVVQSGAEQLTLVNEWLKARVRLKPEEEALYREPNDNLARALGQGLAAVAHDTPLLVMLDTYEIVARADPWVRTVVKTAGPRVVWVIAGRDNLAPSRPAAHYVGYSGEFPRRLTAWDVQELAIDYVAEYLHDRAPARPATREEAEALHRATLGVPLALKQAADLWASGVPLSAITQGIPDRTPRDEIVKLMSQRILIHCDDPALRRALYLLAMQRRPDASVQTAVLRPDQGPFDLMAHMDSLATCYSSIRVTGGARLHEASAAFMREYLLTPEMRAGDEVKAIAVRASSAARQRQQKLEEELARLEDRCESDDWQEAVLDTVHWLLWHDEAATWRELMPRLIEGLGYRPRLAGSLLEVASALEIALSNDGRRRLKTLEQGMGDKATADDESTLLSELERWLKQHDAQDAYAAERRTVLDLLRGELFYRLEKYADALRQYKRVERGLPEDGEVLKKRLGAVFCDVGWELGWERGRALPSEEARLALACAVELVPDNSAYRVGLGVMLYGLKQQKKLLPR